MSRSRKKARVEIGSISHGTLRTEDLLEAFADELERLAPRGSKANDGSYPNARLIREARIASDYLAFGCDDDVPHNVERGPLARFAEEYGAGAEDAASEILQSLEDALSALAPEGLYFGAIEGDGSDFGFWPCSEFLENPEDFDVLSVSDLSEVPGDYFGTIALVNDHGNITVYHRARNYRLAELWSAV